MKSIAVIFIFITFSLSGCDSWKSNPLDENHTVTIRNSTDCDIYVSLDFVEFLHLPFRNDEGIFENVSEDTHELVAYKAYADGYQEELTRLSIMVTERKDYYWTIKDCSP